MPIRSYYQTQYGLKGNPFPSKATHGEDSQTIYVPEAFGPQRPEFLRKFVLAPLENGQPVIGAVWSVAEGDPTARGFGKSTLMDEEAKQIDFDFGKSTLVSLGVPEHDTQSTPVLAGYVSFNVAGYGSISSIDAAAFNLARYILRVRDSQGVSTHAKLRERAAAQLVSQGKAVAGNESESIIAAIRERFQKLAVTVDIRNLLDDYVNHLASPDTNALEQFLSSEVSTWHHDRNGLKYLQILVVFADIAGVEHFTFFIDQVEDFTSIAGAAKIQKNVKIIRDALIEAEPFSSKASFVFQLHPDAYYRLRDAWEHEDLPSLEYDDPLNEPAIVVLKGLEEFESAHLLVQGILNHPSIALANRRGGIAPFTESGLKCVWEATKPNPRDFLRALNRLLELGNNQHIATLDEEFILPKIEHLARSSSVNESSETTDERTT
jgi:hypothetical protein